MKFRICILVLSAFSSCQSGLVPYSQRSIGGIPKMGTDKAVGTSRPVGGETKQSSEYYVKNKEINIVPKDPENTTGSLFKIDDARNYFFAARAPVQVGTYIDVKVATNLIEKKEPSANTPNADPKQQNFSEIEQAIKDSLPDLTPSNDGDAKLLKQIKMKVEHEYPNGDVLVRFKRGSIVENYANEVNVAARIPYETLVSGKPIETTDLGDVAWVESKDGEVIQRYSAAWEDEYSARISGFDEAKSRIAMDLESKRRQLDESKKRLENRLNAMGSERTKIAKERDEVNNLRKESEEKVKDLEDKNGEQEKEIEELKSELDQIRPAQDKPGDRKDGADGP